MLEAVRVWDTSFWGQEGEAGAAPNAWFPKECCKSCSQKATVLLAGMSHRRREFIPPACKIQRKDKKMRSGP